jgi:hypothetical protein
VLLTQKVSLRIVHVLNHVSKANGHVCAVVDLACTQVKMGHEVFVCSGGGDFEGLLSAHGIAHIKVNHTRKMVALLKSMVVLARAFRRLKDPLKAAHPDNVSKIKPGHIIVSKLFIGLMAMPSCEPPAPVRWWHPA